MTWSQPHTAAEWGQNAYMAGEYVCVAPITQQSHGLTQFVQLSTSQRLGSATFLCSSGNWSVVSGTCDGAVKGVQTVQYFEHPDYFVGYVLQNCWTKVFKGLGRGMSAGEMDYWWRRGVSGVPREQLCREVGASQEFMAVQILGHMAPEAEANICGPGFGYPWQGQGQLCKARP